MKANVRHSYRTSRAGFNLDRLRTNYCLDFERHGMNKPPQVLSNVLIANMPTLHNQHSRHTRYACLTTYATFKGLEDSQALHLSKAK